MESRRTFLLGMLALGLPIRAAADGFPGGLQGTLGSRFGARTTLSDLRRRRPRPSAGALRRLRHWNEIAVDASGLDHTPVPAGDSRVFGEQLGPGRSSRAMAIVHIAVFDAMNAVAGGYQGYTGLRPAARRHLDRGRHRAGRARDADRPVPLAEGRSRRGARRGSPGHS